MNNTGTKIDSAVATNTILQIQNTATTPTGNLTEWLNTSGSILSRIDSAGTIISGNGFQGSGILNTSGQTTIIISGSRNVGLASSSISVGGGSGVVFIGNATTVPTSNPTGGGILYVENGALKYRGSSGTVTIIANA